MPAIVHIIDFGTAWTVKLDCGCSRKGLTAEDIEREQLYVDKESRVRKARKGALSKRAASGRPWV